jgi:hypothetical protein
MLRVARSICAESASCESFRRNQRPANGDGARAEGSVVVTPGASTIQVAQDKFLEKTVEVYLE